MQLVRCLRIPALLCAFAVLVCEFIARPYTSMGICDDGPYILMTRTLANTGHLVYNGWPAAMLGLQLYVGAAFIKLFGFSFTAVRMSTLLIAMLTAFVLQRILVRSGITERNATLGTLALVLSPLYLMLSVTFMSDIFGLFAVVLCLYGCLRALQSSSDRAAIAWLCFAVLTNALCGTARQIAWLGILVMLPSTLWLLRARRRVLIAGSVATLAGVIFILACMHWLARQPYVQPEHLIPDTFPIAHAFRQFTHFFLDVPFLLLPILALFLPEIRKSNPRVIAVLFALLLGYLFLATYPSHLRGGFPLEPTVGEWLGVHGIYDGVTLPGEPPIFLPKALQVLLTIASLGGPLGLIAGLLRLKDGSPHLDSSRRIFWKRLAILITPFTMAYVILLVPRAATFHLTDRYLLGLLPVALLVLVGYYQDLIQPRLPLSILLVVGIMAVYGIAITYNTFALYRARVAIAAEIYAAGIPDTLVDGGWEYNLVVEIDHANFINFPTITVPAHAYVRTPPPPAGICQVMNYDNYPRIHPLYGVSFSPNACYGPAPFAPVHYSRWLASTPGTLYVVRYSRDVKP